MTILVSTDNRLQGGPDLTQLVEASVGAALSHFTDRITRVEVHVGDVNGHKGGDDDLHCSMEARPEGLKPVGVTHHAGSIEDAVEGAAGKLKRTLEHTFGRLKDR